MSHLIDLLIDAGVLLNVSICLRDVGFRLVVIVIADKILYGVFGEKIFEFTIELSGQGFIGCHNKCRFLHPVYDLCNCISLAGPGYT